MFLMYCESLYLPRVVEDPMKASRLQSLSATMSNTSSSLFLYPENLKTPPDRSTSCELRASYITE
eukprot:228433-Hanusia_phi.AAC.4